LPAPRVLLDECLDWRFAKYLTGVEVRTVQQLGWSSIQNGALLSLAQKQFDVFITADRNLSSQQHLPGYTLAVLVLAVRVNKLDHLIPLAQRALAVLPVLLPGTVTILEEE